MSYTLLPFIARMASRGFILAVVVGNSLCNILHEEIMFLHKLFSTVDYFFADDCNIPNQILS